MAKNVSGDARINWVDMARGYGIILVIIGHIESFGTQWDHVLRSEIYSFHMPLFFMISGALLLKKEESLKAGEKLLIIKQV